MYKQILGIILCILTLTAYADSIQNERNGINITDDAAISFETAKIVIDGQGFKKLILPEQYNSAGSFPGTETFERIYTFAVPEGSVPELTYNVSVAAFFKVSELAPVKTFSKDNFGMYSEVYKTPDKRVDAELAHAEIVRFGRYGKMELYSLVIRPLVVRGSTAEYAGRTDAKITFSGEFPNEGVKGGKTNDIFMNSVVNLDYALANPVSNVKTKEPCFLDHQTEWVKVKIKDEGIYRITGASLRSLGLDLSSVLCDKIKVFSSAGKDIDNNPTVPSYHGAQQITRNITDVNNDGFFNDNDYIVFYAVSTVARDGAEQKYYFNKYSEHTYYWIDLGTGSLDNGLNMPELSVGGTAFDQELSVFKRHIFSDSRDSYYFDDGYFFWYDRSIDPYDSQVLSFQTKDLYDTDSVTVRVNHSDEITDNSKFSYIINGDVLSETISSDTIFVQKFSSDFFYPNSINTLTMRNIGTSTKYLNGYEIVYSGPVSGSSSDEYFYLEGYTGQNCRLDLQSSSGRSLFNISDPGNVSTSILTDNYCIVNPEGKDSYLLFSGIYRSPVSMSVYDNRYNGSLHSRDTTADMVIIVPEDFYTFFNNDETGREYISAHLSYDNGVNSIFIASMNSISDEFGRGYQEPAATRNFIRYAYDNWETEYFLLAGDGNYYIRPEMLFTEKNYIYTAEPSYIPPTSLNEGSRGSDDFYANLYSIYPAQNVSLGRLTVSNLSELKNIISKTTAFMKNADVDNQRAKILLIGDDERNTNYSTISWTESLHISNTESYIVPAIPEYYYTDKLYLTEYPFEYSVATGMYLKPKAEQDLVRKLNTGLNFVCYVGHGAPMQLAHERVFTPSSFSNVNNFDKYFFFFGATCSFGVFSNPDMKYLSEQMLISSGKGSVGLINSVTEVYSYANESLVRSFLNSEFNDRNDKLTIGKALKEGKNSVRSWNSAKYMLIGDPALKLFGDKNIVRSSSSVELYTLTPDSITSYLDPAVSIPEMNGTLNTVIVDSKVKRAYYNTEHWEGTSIDTLRYTLPGKIILSAKSEIKDGSSVTKFILPKDLNYGDNKGKVLFYGRNLDGIEFTGSIDSVSIRGDGTVLTVDSIPPKISLFYNSFNYLPGDPVGQSPVILAKIEDENGINTSGGIGHKILMEADGNQVDVTPNFSYDMNSWQSGYTSYQFVGLSPGEHNIKISAWDNFNNYNEKTESFTVVDESSKSSKWIGNLLNYPNPVGKKGTTFGFSVNLPSELRSYSITIYTINGRKVKTVEGSPVDLSDQFQSVEWEGKDADGDIPANGVYIYILRAKFNDGKTVNKKGKLIFAR